MYIHHIRKFTVLNNQYKYDSWEYQIIKITNESLTKNIIGNNIYRPPNDLQQSYRQCFDEFAILLSTFDKVNS